MTVARILTACLDEAATEDATFAVVAGPTPIDEDLASLGPSG